MNLNEIKVILDDSGNILNDYLEIPVINQYATNYILEVAFEHDYEDPRVHTVTFYIGGIEGKQLPARLMTPTSRRFKLNDGTESSYICEYKLTQYETQIYQDNLEFTVNIKSGEYDISNFKLSTTMTKQRYAKLTPANLDEDSSINSIVQSVAEFDKTIDERGNQIENRVDEKIEEIRGELDSEIDSINSRIDSETSYLNDKISSVETTCDEKFMNIESDLSDKYWELKGEIDYVSSNQESTINGLITEYDAYADTKFALKNEVSEALTSAVDYTDFRVAELVDSAPETLDTIRELAEALQGQDDVISALEQSIGEKANQSDLDGKIDKLEAVSGYDRVLAQTAGSTDVWGLQVGTNIAYIPSSNRAVACYNPVGRGNNTVSSGKLVTGVPTYPYDAANKKYVDESLDGKLDKTTNKAVLYGTGNDGSQTTYKIAIDPPLYQFTIPERDNLGRIQTRAPAADLHCANKKYVDDLVNGTVVELSGDHITIALENNTQYTCVDPVKYLDISLVDGAAGQPEQWSIIFKIDSDFSTIMVPTSKWAAAVPSFSINKTYMITFIRFLDEYIGVWTVA